MGMAYVRIFFDWLEATQPLNHEEKGRLIDAIIRYARDPEAELEMPGNERFVFPAFMQQLDRDTANYDKACRRTSYNARAGALFKDKDEDKEKDKDKDKDEDKEPSVLKNNNNWRTSVRARGAVAQMIVDAALSEELGCAGNSNLHELLVEAMENGLAPELLMELCRRSNDMPLGALLYEEMQSRGLRGR